MIFQIIMNKFCSQGNNINILAWKIWRHWLKQEVVQWASKTIPQAEKTELKEPEVQMLTHPHSGPHGNTDEAWRSSPRSAARTQFPKYCLRLHLFSREPKHNSRLFIFDFNFLKFGMNMYFLKFLLLNIAYLHLYIYLSLYFT